MHPSLTAPILFIAGSLRSGSTLMSLMLDRHSSIGNPGEFDFLFDAFGPDGGLAAAQALGLQDFDDFLRDDRIYLSRSRRMPEGANNAARLRAYVNSLAGDGQGWLALNIHRNFVSAHEVFPEARFIHLVRDPRDCARSSIGMGWAGNVYFGLEPWIAAERSWDLLRPRLPAGQALELHFEELVTQPRVVLTRICTFLGLAYDENMLDLSGTTYEPPSAKFANQWRRQLSVGDLRLVEARVGDMMAARGYEPVDRAAPRPGRLAMLGLNLQNAAYRHRFRIGRYGLCLWLQELVARRLGWHSISRQLRHRMMPIDIRHLK